MKNLETLKTRSQASMAHLVDLGKQQPSEVKTWGVTAASAAAGGIALAATAKGALAIIGLLAAPQVSLTVGALGGGVLGWRYLQRRSESLATEQPVASTPAETVYTPMAVSAPTAVPPVEEYAPVEQTFQASDLVQTSELTPLETPLEEVRFAEVPVVVAPLPETVAPVEPVVPAAPPAPLEVINGIGAGYARRLHEANIHTFADLAQQTPEQLRALIHVDKWVTDEELRSWIEQAQGLAAQ